MLSQPFINVSNDTFLLFSTFDLAESIYESPYFWMMSDNTYRSQMSKNRGAFVEEFCLANLAKFFGSKNIYANVDIIAKKGKNPGEIDVLVVYVDRLIIVQCKAKRLTIAAKSGDGDLLNKDFKAAIQDAYDQAILCAKEILERSVTL